MHPPRPLLQKLEKAGKTGKENRTKSGRANEKTRETERTLFPLFSFCQKSAFFPEITGRKDVLRPDGTGFRFPGKAPTY